jgi:hypothetical protein
MEHKLKISPGRIVYIDPVNRTGVICVHHPNKNYIQGIVGKFTGESYYSIREEDCRRPMEIMWPMLHRYSKTESRPFEQLDEMEAYIDFDEAADDGRAYVSVYVDIEKPKGDNASER